MVRRNRVFRTLHLAFNDCWTLPCPLQRPAGVRRSVRSASTKPLLIEDPITYGSHAAQAPGEPLRELLREEAPFGEHFRTQFALAASSAQAALLLQTSCGC